MGRRLRQHYSAPELLQYQSADLYTLTGKKQTVAHRSTDDADGSDFIGPVFSHPRAGWGVWLGTPTSNVHEVSGLSVLDHACHQESIQTAEIWVLGDLSKVSVSAPADNELVLENIADCSKQCPGTTLKIIKGRPPRMIWSNP
jgi:hypothetical protein